MGTNFNVKAGNNVGKIVTKNDNIFPRKGENELTRRSNISFSRNTPLQSHLMLFIKIMSLNYAR
jgi:hypothetical protein